MSVEVGGVKAGGGGSLVAFGAGAAGAAMLLKAAVA